MSLSRSLQRYFSIPTWGKVLIGFQGAFLVTASVLFFFPNAINGLLS